MKSVDKIINELMIKNLQDSLDVRTIECDELRQELESLKARIDGGVRVWARLSPNYVRADDIRTYKTCASKSNATLILDDGVEL